MIIEEIDESLFISRFEDYERVCTIEKPNGNFSYAGLRALYNYLDDTYTEEAPLKLDVISLCCDYSEYKNLNEYIRDYYNSDELKEILINLEGDTEEEKQEALKRYMEEEISSKTILIKIEDDLDKGFIIQNY